jgi:hypothetical protein
MELDDHPAKSIAASTILQEINLAVKIMLH